MKKIAVLFTLLISVISLQAQTSRTWTGSTSTDWNTAANWSPSGVPSSSDHVVLNNGSLTNMPLLDANRSITNITVSTGTINLNGYTLTVTGTTSLTGGAVNNGTASFINATTAIAGTTFGAAVNISSGAVTVTNSIFNSPVSIVKSGTSTDSWAGGNTFNSTLDISLSNGSVDLVNYLTGNTYNDNITVSNTGSGRIRFNTYTNTSTLASGKTIAIGSGGYNSGTLTINGIAISGSVAQSFTLTGTSTLNLANITFGGTVSISSPNFNLGYSTFNGAVSVTKNGSGTASWEGGNTFNSTLDVNVSGGNLNLNSWTNTNTFNDNVTISNTSSGSVKLSSYSNTNYLASGKTITVGSGGFASGNLYINNVSQSGTTAQNFTVTGSAGLFIETSTWGGNITATGPSVNLNGGTYNGTVIVNKNGSATAGWGGCTFNSTLDVNVSAGSLNLTSWVYGNNYNNNVTVSNTGSGTINFNSYSANSYLASGKTISVGSGGFATGTLTISGITQSGTTAQNFTVTGTAALNINSSTWGGGITATGPSVTIGGGSTFNGAVTVNKNGSTANGWAGAGANTFNSALDINVSSGNLDLAGWTFSNNYNGNVTISNTGSGTIRFNGYTNTSTLAAGKTISIGTGGFASGNLYINGITQSGSTAQNITLTGTSASLYLTNSTFNGVITASAPNVISGGSTFNSDFTVTKSSSSTNSWTANTYNGNVSITNTGSGYINMSNVVSGGDIYNGNATFTKSGTGDVIIAGSGSTVTFKGNVTLNNISSTQFSGSQGALFTGTAAQTLNQSSSTLNFGRVTINKASNNLTLNAPLTVSTALTLTSGKIVTTGTNLLNLVDNATVSSASNSSYVQGPMSKTGNDAFTFPTGKAGYYRPIGITSPSSTATVFTAEYVDATQTLGTSADTSIANLSDCEHWTLTRSGSTSNVNVTLAWNSASCNGAVATNMRVAGWNGSTWTNYGNGTRTGNATAGTVTSNTNPTAYNAFALTNKNCTGVATITPSGATSFCSGGSVTLTAPAGAKKYTWLPSSISQSINASASNSYIVKVADTLGCVGKDTVDVTVWANPTVSADSDTFIVAGDTIQLNASAGSGTSPYSYLWTPSTGLSSTIVNNPFANPSENTIYSVTVTDGHGCIKRDTINLKVYDFTLSANTDTLEWMDSLLVSLSHVGFTAGQQYTIRFGDDCHTDLGYDNTTCDDTFTIANIPQLKRYAETGNFSIKVSTKLGDRTLAKYINVVSLPYDVAYEDNPCNRIINTCMDVNTNADLTGSNRSLISNASPWYAPGEPLPNWDVGSHSNPNPPYPCSPYSGWTPPPANSVNSFFDYINTPDYFNDQSTPPFDILNPTSPSNQTGPGQQAAYGGDDGCRHSYIGIATYVQSNVFHRECIAQDFFVGTGNELTPGVEYKLSFQGNLADNSFWQTGLAARIIQSTTNAINNISLTATGNISNRDTWTKFEGFFKPTVTSRYELQIGGTEQFNCTPPTASPLNNQPTCCNGGTWPTGANSAYYYIADVKMEPAGDLSVNGNTATNQIYTLCYGESLTLTGAISTTTNPNSGLLWENLHVTNPTDPTFSGQESNTSITITPPWISGLYTAYKYTLSTTIAGCTKIINIEVDVFSTTVNDFAIVGPTTNCNLSSTYSISPTTTDATYHWEVPAGVTVTPEYGTSVTINWGEVAGGTITVTGNNGCKKIVTLNVGPCCTPDFQIIDANASDLAGLFPGFVSSGSGIVTITGNYVNQAAPGFEIGILGTLTIDAGVNQLIMQDVNIVLGPNAKIIFANNNNLQNFTIDNSWLHACGNSLWDMIYAHNRFKSIDVANSSIIEDAKIAISSFGGAQFTVTNSTLNKNFRHIKAAKGIYGTSPATISGSTLTCSANLLPSYPTMYSPNTNQTYIGIDLIGMPNFEVGNTTSSTNTIEKSYYGIYAYSSTASVDNNYFQTQYGIYSLGKNKGTYALNVGTIASNTFFKCYVGVSANTNINLDVEGNTFDQNGLIGIWYTNNGAYSTGSLLPGSVASNNVFVFDNTITKTPFGIVGINNKRSNSLLKDNHIDFSTFAPSDQGMTYGVFLSENSAPSWYQQNSNYKIIDNDINSARYGIWGNSLGGSYVYNNTVNLTANTFPTYLDPFNGGVRLINNVGTIVWNNTVNGGSNTDPDYLDPRMEGIRIDNGYFTIVTCNTINDANTKYTGRGIDYSKHFLSIMRGNNMQNTQAGLVLKMGSIITEQGDLSNPSDNQWIPGGFPAGDLRTEDGTDGPLSQLFVRANGDYLPQGVAGTTPYITFNSSASGSYYDCGTLLGLTPSHFEGVALRLLHHNTGYDSLPELDEYQMRQAIYSYYKLYPDSFSAVTDLVNFALDMDTSNIGKMRVADSLINFGYINWVAAARPDTVFEAQDSTEFAQNSFVTLVTNLSNAEDMLNSITPANDIETASKIVKLIQIDAYRRMEEYIDSSKIDTDNEAYYWQKINDSLFTDENLLVLDSIALLCPFVSGPDVYTARNIMMQQSDTLFKYYALYRNTCEDGILASTRKMQDVNDDSIVAIYPNPAMNFVTVAINADVVDGRFEVYDYTGKLIITKPLNTKYTTVDLPDYLPNSLYYVRVINVNEIIKNDKLVIIR